MPDIWRVEQYDGRGMYADGFFDGVVEDAGAWHPGDQWSFGSTPHPAPGCDPLIGDDWQELSASYSHKRWYFGFSDLSQFKAWTINARVRELLAARGAWLVRYDVPDDSLKAGLSQAIFLKSPATVVETLSTVLPEDAHLEELAA